VNISARQFQEPDFVDQVAAILSEMDLAPGLLGLEITEHTLIEDLDAAAATLRALKDLGVQVAIDDFGIGYSSLGYLSRLPVDVLKIDRAFVAGVDQHGSHQAIVKAISAIAQAVGFLVTAEGIERAEELAALRRLGVERGQGYYFSKPLPAADLVEWLKQRQGQGETDEQPEKWSAQGVLPST
jgi:EAL domain-containing protein (putative c-di-GMP-specific phosphodiesterase class I)